MNDRTDDRPNESDASTLRYWYMSVSFVAAVVISTMYMTFLILLGGQSTLQGGIFVIWLGGLSVLGVLTYPALLKDTASVRVREFTWQPKSWYYILIGFSAPFVVFLLLGQQYPLIVGILLSVIIFILVTCVVNAFYLYRRHRFLGTP